MNNIEKNSYFLSIFLFLLSACVPICDTKELAVFKNCTNDTLLICASHYDNISCIDYQLQPSYLPSNNTSGDIKISLWTEINASKEIIYPDSTCTIDGKYLFADKDTCYFYLIKYKDAINNHWNEICKEHLYGKSIITKNKDGKFNTEIK